MKKKTRTIKNSIPADKKIPTEFKNTLSELVPHSVWNTQQLNNLETLYTNNRYSPLTIQRIVLNYLYMEHGLIQSLIDQPVSDALRGGIEITSDEIDGEDIKGWQESLQRDNVLSVFKETVCWARLFGGAGTIINAHEDPAKPFKIESIKKGAEVEFYPADRWELSAPNRINEFFTFYNVKIHRSRVLTINGKAAPAIVRPQLAGWGMSECEHVVRELNMYLKHNNLVFELLDEAKVDVWKINGFNNSLITSEGTELIRRRIQMSNQLKSYHSAVVMDKEDDYDQKTMTFGGLSEMLREIRIGIATALRMPMTKLFGLSASGFNSGQEDLENYNAMIESEIRDRMRHPLNELLRVTARMEFGYVPDFQFKFKPLRVMDAVQEETVNSSFQNRMIQLHQTQLMTGPEVIESLQTRDLMPVKVEASTIEDYPAQTRQDELIEQQATQDGDKDPDNAGKDGKPGDAGNPKNPATAKEKKPAQGEPKK